MPGKSPAPLINWKRLLRATLIGAVAIYLVIVLAMVIFQRHLVYIPSGIVNMTPEDAGLKYEEVKLTADDGTTLHAWFVPAEEERAVVLFCHGNAGNISGRLAMLELLHSLNLSTLIFDYRGYGKSTGTPSEEGTYLDGQAAWDHLAKQRGYRPDQIVVFGRSLGGGIASKLAANNRPSSLVLMSTFTSLPAVGQEAYPFMPVKLLSRYSYPVMENLANVDAPVLIMHGPQDEVIPFHHGRELLRAAGPSRRFAKLKGGHNNAIPVSEEIIVGAIDSLLAEQLP